MTRGILLDIEGTTTPITFVYDVLFPFARAHAHEHLDEDAQHALKLEYDRDVASGLAARGLVFRRARLCPLADGSGSEIDRVKDSSRKDLAGRLSPRRAARRSVSRCSTGTRTLASRGYRCSNLFFRQCSRAAVDLLNDTARRSHPLSEGYFDTTTGPKTEASSYGAIAAAFALPAPEILFISDVVRELDAAAAAGLQATLVMRPGNPPQPPNSYPTVSSFEEI